MIERWVSIRRLHLRLSDDGVDEGGQVCCELLALGEGRERGVGLTFRGGCCGCHFCCLFLFYARGWLVVCAGKGWVVLGVLNRGRDPGGWCLEWQFKLGESPALNLFKCSERARGGAQVVPNALCSDRNGRDPSPGRDCSERHSPLHNFPTAEPTIIFQAYRL